MAGVLYATLEDIKLASTDEPLTDRNILGVHSNS